MGMIIKFPSPTKRALDQRYFDLGNWRASEQGWPTIKIEHRWVALRRSGRGWSWGSGPLNGYGRVADPWWSERVYPDERTARWKAWAMVCHWIERERQDLLGSSVASDASVVSDNDGDMPPAA